VGGRLFKKLFQYIYLRYKSKRKPTRNMGPNVFEIASSVFDGLAMTIFARFQLFLNGVNYILVGIFFFAI